MQKTKTTRKHFVLPVALLAAFLVALLLPMSTHAALIQSDTEASVSFDPGALSLIEVPSLYFGAKPISETTEVYTAATISNPIAVSDLRGNDIGWKLTASLTPFNHGSVDSGTLTLAGAFITITDQAVAGAGDNIAPAPQAESPVVLNSDGNAALVVGAQAGTGMGRWNVSWQTANTTLTVLPGTAREGDSFATINWTLEDTP